MRPTTRSVALDVVHNIAFKVGVDVSDYSDPLKLANAVLEEAQCEGLTVIRTTLPEHCRAAFDRIDLNIAMATGARNILRGDWGL